MFTDDKFSIKLDSSEMQQVQLKLYGISSSNEQEVETHLEEFSIQVKDYLSKLFDQKEHIYELKGKSCAVLVNI